MRTAAPESGFTVIEVLIAALVFSIGSFAVFGIVRQFATGAALTSALTQDEGTVDRLAAALSSDASTALAIYDPGDDACSGSTSATLSMYYKDTGGEAQTVTYADQGGTVTRTNSATGSQATFGNVSLRAQCVGATALVARENLAQYLPGVTVHDYPVNFGSDGRGAEQTGGNRVVVARVAGTTTNSARELHLFAGSVPTGFTIVGPQWHAVVYREDHTRRFLFGLGQTSWLRIMAEVDVSYDGWRSRAVWCNFEALEVYGGQPAFNKDDVPVFAGASDVSPAPTRIAVPDLYPETLLDYCRNHVSADPPGSLGGTWATPGPLPAADDQVVAIPPWWVWQTCGPSMTCPPGTQPPATCDPLTPGSCTVTVPDTPPQGWDAWCAQWSPPVWGAPSFGPPCAAATPPPPPPPPPSPPPTPPANQTTLAYAGYAPGCDPSIGSCNEFLLNTDGAGGPGSGILEIAFTTASGSFSVAITSDQAAALSWQLDRSCSGASMSGPLTNPGPGAYCLVLQTLLTGGAEILTGSITVSDN
jgi:Tfp pilus assembly protein PilV